MGPASHFTDVLELCLALSMLQVDFKVCQVAAHACAKQVCGPNNQLANVSCVLNSFPLHIADYVLNLCIAPHPCTMLVRTERVRASAHVFDSMRCLHIVQCFSSLLAGGFVCNIILIIFSQV